MGNWRTLYDHAGKTIIWLAENGCWTEFDRVAFDAMDDTSLKAVRGAFKAARRCEHGSVVIVGEQTADGQIRAAWVRARRTPKKQADPVVYCLERKLRKARAQRTADIERIRELKCENET